MAENTTPKKTMYSMVDVSEKPPLSINPGAQQRLRSLLPTHMMNDEDKCYLFLAQFNMELGGNAKLRKLWESGANGQMRIITAAGVAARLGLRFGTHCHLVPYGDDPTLLTNYQGKMALMRQDPDLVLFTPEVVHENDTIRLAKKFTADGVVTELDHQLSTRDRGEIIGVYIGWTYKGVPNFLYKDVDTLMEHGRKFAKNFEKVWKKNPVPMMTKTLIHMLSKYLNTDPEVASVAMEGMYDEGSTVDVGTVRSAPSRNQAAAAEPVVMEPAKPAKPAKPEPAPLIQQEEQAAPPAEDDDGLSNYGDE